MTQTTEFRGRTAATAVRWSSLSVIGRQVSQLIFAVVVARILGPESYGVISAATIYVMLTAMLLDQGLSSALVQRRELAPRAPGAIASVNLLTAVVLGVATSLVAPWIGEFFGSADLTVILRWLGLGLLAKAFAIAPRAILMRGLRLKPVGVADIVGAALGSVAGIVAALLGAGPEALVYQTLLGDTVVALLLFAAARGPRPNFDMALVRDLLPFGTRVFATNSLAYVSRYSDNILVGRFLGVTSLSYYSMAYRVLVIPVQLIGQTVNRVMFPAFARIAEDRKRLAATLITATELLAVVTLPSMALLACASTPLVELVLGAAWLPAAPLMAVLAIAGARETLFYITPSLMKATGNAAMNLRYEILSTAVQLTGIVVGLFFGVNGVAIGYAVAGFTLIPVLLSIQRRLTGVRIRSQLGAIAPALHASGWAALTYLLLHLIPLVLPLRLLVSAAGFVIVTVGVLAVFHRAYSARALRRLLAIAGRGDRRELEGV